jgi:alanyl-tRNA synthetase
MTSDEIRERFLEFFEQHGHRRIPSASLVPSAHDSSALLTVAGMHPLKPYFLGQETPPAKRLTDCQKVFRTVDIDNVGNTARHLTFFEMLGNFSFGDYFKHDAIEFAWKLSRDVYGFAGDDIWVTVFEGDGELDIGPDDEAIGLWQQMGVPRERIVLCPRSENFWQAGPSGPCGPCSELYLDRGEQYGSPGDLPGGENERFLEYWNLVFMQYDAGATGDRGAVALRPLPVNNIDTGMGLNRMAAILQGKASVFETDQFQPLIELGEELSQRAYGEDHQSDRALRILADHSRAMTFLLADGVVPSNEERGYVLRRVMRRAIQQARALEFAPGFLTRYAARVRELMGTAYPEIREHAESIDMWLSAEEEGFGRTLAHGIELLQSEIARARDAGAVAVSAETVFRLHDTFGFPRELTEEILDEEGLSIEGDFDQLMDRQRRRGREGEGAGAAGGERDTGAEIGGDRAGAVLGELASIGERTRFTGYETEDQRTTVGAVRAVTLARPDSEDAEAARGERYLVKLAESPFYAPGGGQIADVGTIECEDGDCRGQVADVLRVGDDQALEVVLERGSLREGEAVHARVDHLRRHETEANHTATHLLQAALRERLGSHVRQAGSYVGPDKLRFDFSHGQGLSEQELRDVEDRVNEWIARNDPVRAITTTLDEAKALGAMALFGEKYGDVVRMVEIGDGEHSRELCGGTHVRRTAEIGPFTILAETSSAANVRRIEALTGPAAVTLLRRHDRELGEIAAALRTRPEGAAELVRTRERERRELEKALKAVSGARDASGGMDIDELAARVRDVAGVQLLSAIVEVQDAKALLDIADRLKGRLDDGAVVLGAAVDGRAHLLVSVAPALVARGVKAGAVVKAAAEAVGGGGGGRDTLAQAGGREPDRLDEALDAARASIASALQG